MSNPVFIRCLVHGDTFARTFKVQVLESDDVIDLKTLIKNAVSPAFKDIDANELDLYKADIEIGEDEDTPQAPALDTQARLRVNRRLMDQLSKVFEDNHIYIIVKRPAHAPTGTESLSSTHPLVKFWSSLCDGRVTITQDWIILEEQIRWIATEGYGRHLYIREVYNEFWDIIKNSGKKSWTVTGTPGIGKTFFGFFMLFKIHEHNKNASIVRMGRNGTFIFRPDGSVLEASVIPELFFVEPQNWVIADAILPRMEVVDCRTVVVTSPKLSGESLLAKNFFQFRYMPLWSSEEIENLRGKVYSDLDPGDVGMEFELWGGVPRTVLQHKDDKAWKRRLQSALNINQLKKCMKFDSEFHYSNIDQVSGKLVHLVPVDEECTKAQVTWASQKLCDYALISLTMHDVQKAKNLIKATSSLGDYGSLRGNLFEKFAHVIISAGGEFQARNLEDNSMTSVNFRQLQRYTFRNTGDIQADRYNIPLSKTFRSVDSLIPPRDLLQMTVSLTHGINERGLNELNLQGSPINFYFVTPADNIASFRKARLTNDWGDRIKQNVIGIDLDSKMAEYRDWAKSNVVGTELEYLLRR